MGKRDSSLEGMARARPNFASTLQLNDRVAEGQIAEMDTSLSLPRSAVQRAVIILRLTTHYKLL